MVERTGVEGGKKSRVLERHFVQEAKSCCIWIHGVARLR